VKGSEYEDRQWSSAVGSLPAECCSCIGLLNETPQYIGDAEALRALAGAVVDRGEGVTSKTRLAARAPLTSCRSTNDNERQRTASLSNFETGRCSRYCEAGINMAALCDAQEQCCSGN